MPTLGTGEVASSFSGCTSGQRLLPGDECFTECAAGEQGREEGDQE